MLFLGLPHLGKVLNALNPLILKILVQFCEQIRTFAFR